MLEFLLEPWGFPFMQRAMVAASLAAVVCALVGPFVVLKGMAFMGDAVAHSSLSGMAVAFLLGGNVFLGALAWAVPASITITFITQRAKLRIDTAIGIIFAGGFALGIILMSQGDNYTADLFGLLFGNVLGASWDEVALIGGIAAAVALVLLVFYKELLFTSYDSTMAAASGIPVRFLDYLLPALVAVTAVACLKAVGIVLVLALLVTPAAAGSLLARRLPGMMGASLALALVATGIGLYLSYYLDLPSGPSIVMVSTGLFVLTFIFAPRKGMISKWRASQVGKALGAGA